VLDGELADRARIAVREIADGLATADISPVDRAVFWAYVAPELGAVADPHVQSAVEQLPDALSTVHGVGLYGGLAGLGWTLAHLIEGADEILEQIDANLVERVRQWTGHYDLISGLAGLAVYFLERGEAPSAVAGLDAIVAELDRLAERTPEGITWHTPLALVPDNDHVRYPSGWYNVGVAHGVPGVIATLARLSPTPKVVELRDGAIAWVLAQRTADPARSRFPSIASPRHDGTARTAWCYGDPGVVLALRNAGRADVDAIALAALTRPLAETGCTDGALCHGTIGLAHIANRMFHLTGDPAFRDAARAWYATTLDRARPDSASFLEGAAGIGLALAAATSTNEPLWDRLLAMAPP